MRCWIFVLLLSTPLLAGNPHDLDIEIGELLFLPPDGAEFQEKVRRLADALQEPQVKASNEALDALLERLTGLDSPSASFTVRVVAEAYCRQSGSKGIQAVVLKARRAATTALEGALLRGASACKVRRVAERILRGSPLPRLRLEVEDVPLPNWLLEGSPRLQDAWTRHRTLSDLYDRVLVAKDRSDRIPVNVNWGPFNQTLAEAIEGKLLGNVADTIGAYDWRANCGTGSGLLRIPQADAILWDSLQTGRQDMVLAALVRRESYSGFFSGARTSMRDLKRKLLTHLGEDWEEIYLGTVLNGGHERSLVYELLSYGSENTPFELLEVVGLKGSSYSNGVLASLRALILDDLVSLESLPFDDVTLWRERVSAETRAELLRGLIALIDAGNDLSSSVLSSLSGVDDDNVREAA